MISQQAPLPWYLVNRDLKRELRLVPPGYHEKIGKARVYRHCGEDMHEYYINGNRVTLDEAADICSGRKSMPPYPKAKAKRKRTPKAEPLDTLPMFAPSCTALAIWRPVIELPIWELGYFREGSRQKAVPGVNLIQSNVLIVLTMPRIA